MRLSSICICCLLSYCLFPVTSQLFQYYSGWLGGWLSGGWPGLLVGSGWLGCLTGGLLAGWAAG